MGKRDILKLVKENTSIVKFCVVGGCSTLLDMIIYFVLYEALGPVFAKMVSMSCCMVFSYNLNKRWSFSVKTKKTRKELCSYFLTQLINMAVNVGTNYLILTATHMKMVAFVVATAIAMVVNYALQKFWVFGNRKDE